MAMDSNMEWASTAGIVSNVAAEGLLFPGYAYLSELAQRPEYRVLAETIPDDATRKWIKFEVAGNDDEVAARKIDDGLDPDGADERREQRIKAADKQEKVKAIEDYLVRLGARESVYDLLVGDHLYGRMHLHFRLQGDDDLQTPIGNGRDAISKAKVTPSSRLIGLKAIEPVWTYPMSYNAVNPLAEDWYNPQYWYVLGRELHVSRIVPFVSRPVPDILKPSYAFGGISMSQLAEPYVNIWLKTRQSVSNMIHSFSVMVLATDLQTLMQANGAEDLLARIALFNTMRDNQGAFVINKASEQMSNVSAPISGLDHLQAQSQEHMASVSRIPLVKLTGISPSGLNASSEGEIQVYYDTVAAFQERKIRPILTRIINFIELSLYGEIDPEITFVFQPLRQMTEKERADLQKAKAERDKIFVDGGAIAPEEWRQAIINDPELPFADLDPDDMPEPPEQEGGFGDPGGDPDGDPDGGAPGGAGAPGGEGVPTPPPSAKGASASRAAPQAGDEWSEADHPRAPDGKFGSGGGGAPLKTSDLKRVGPQMGSNPGGVFEAKDGSRYYVKEGKSSDHVKNELAAVALFKLAGGTTLDYRPVEGGKHIASKIAKLDKKNARDLTPEERKAAQRDFVAHAWLANWDAIGTGGDNIGVVGGKPTALDFGGALAYRAMGSPKGGAFGSTVTEIDMMRNPSKSPDAARFYRSMTAADMVASARRVTRITDDEIADAVQAAGAPADLAKKLIARRDDIASRFGIAKDEADFDEAKHPRDKDGQFAKAGAVAGGAAGGGEEDDDVPKPGAYAGLYVTSGSSPKENHVLTTAKYLGAKVQIGIHYRRMLAKLIKDGEKYGHTAQTQAKLKGMLVESLEKTAAKLTQQGKADEVKKILKTIESLGGPSGKASAAPAPAPKPPEASKPSTKPKAPQATKAELDQAKKTSNLFVPPAHQNNVWVTKLVKEFNDKYGVGTKPLTDMNDLNQKVADFKELQEKVAAFASQELAKQKAAAQKAAQEAAAKLQAKQTKEAEAAAEKNKAIMAELGITAKEAEGFNALADMMGAKNTDLAAKFSGYANTAKQYGYPITGFQAALISNYSDGGYVSINKALREGAWTPKQHVYVKMVNKALAQMPKFEGTLKRGTNLTPAQIAKYKPGHIIQEEAFMSTSPTNPFGGNVEYTVKAIGKRAAHIQKLSQHAGENEVLYQARTFFKVNKVSKRPNGTTHIELEEWEHDDL